VPPLVPTHEIFPREWNGSRGECETLLGHLCEYMEIPRSSISVHFFSDASDPMRFHLPVHESPERGAAGIYHGRMANGAFVVSISAEQLAEPERLIAAICHELGHVHLLGGNRLRREEADHERLTDLLAVFFGAGIFMAGGAYLDAGELAHALACYAWLRGEPDPPWRKHLALRVAPHFDDAIHYIVKTGQVSLLRDVSLDEADRTNRRRNFSDAALR